MGKHAALAIFSTLYFTKAFKKALHVFPCGGQVGVALYMTVGGKGGAAQSYAPWNIL